MAYSFTLPNLVSIDLQRMEIRSGVGGGGGIHPPYLVDFSDPIQFRVKVIDSCQGFCKVPL